MAEIAALDAAAKRLSPVQSIEIEGSVQPIKISLQLLATKNYRWKPERFVLK
jgi:hypothetical protein